MAKPRVFVSSTYYDLKHIRNSLEVFIEQLGYEPVLFESGDIPFDHTQPLDESCYAEVHNCHILVLIVGGRYGSQTSDTPADQDEIAKDEELNRQFDSITKREFETAVNQDKPVFIFVEKNVLAEYDTFKKNRERTDIDYAHVASTNVFRFLDDIYSLHRNNLVKGFERFNDIADWLQEQWAGLFADALSRRTTERKLEDMAVQIDSLRRVTSVLREYSTRLLEEMLPDKSRELISEQEAKLLNARISEFGKEGLVQYLLRNGRFSKTLADTTEDEKVEHLYKALCNSGTLEGFLQQAKLVSSFRKRFLEKHADAALRDFKKLKREFDEAFTGE